MNKSSVVISGSIAIDRIMHFNGKFAAYIHAEKLDSLSVSIFLDSQQDTRGGVGANIAYTLALLGDKPVLLGSVGPDAANYISDLAKLGVETKYIHTSRLPTAAFNVMTDSSNCQIGGFNPGAMFDSESLSFKGWKDADIVAVIAPHDPNAMRRQVAECQRLGLKMCYDIGQQVSNTDGDIMTEGVKAANVLILNEYEMAVLSKKTGLSVPLIKSTVPIVITTLGERGSVVEGSSVESPIEIDIAPPRDVVDPTGAGDAYRAGFLYGYARAWTLKQSAQLGSVCATYALESVGTQAHSFTKDEVAARYFDVYGEKLII